MDTDDKSTLIERRRVSGHHHNRDIAREMCAPLAATLPSPRLDRAVVRAAAGPLRFPGAERGRHNLGRRKANKKNSLVSFCLTSGALTKRELCCAGDEKRAFSVWPVSVCLSLSEDTSQSRSALSAPHPCQEG